MKEARRMRFLTDFQFLLGLRGQDGFFLGGQVGEIYPWGG